MRFVPVTATCSNKLNVRPTPPLGLSAVETRSLTMLWELESRSEAHSSDFGELSNLLTKSNDLYLRVKAPSEGVLDSRVLVSVAQTGRVLADSLKRQSVGFDMDSFMEKAIRFIGGNGAAARAAIAGSENDDGHATNAEWDWNKLGRTAMKYSRRVPATDALLGPLKVEHKKRQTTHRRRNIDRAQQAEKPAEVRSPLPSYHFPVHDDQYG